MTSTLPVSVVISYHLGQNPPGYLMCVNSLSRGEDDVTSGNSPGAHARPVCPFACRPMSHL